MLAKAPNGHLHFALAGALVAASVIGLVLPIWHTRAETRDPSADHVATATKALFAALQSQAQGVTGVVAPPETAGAPKQGGYAPAANPLLTSGFIPQSLLTAAARLAAGTAIGHSQAQAVMGLQREVPVSFTLHIAGFASSQTSSRYTVGDALAALGIRLGADDAVSPPPDSDLGAGLHVYVQYAAHVRLAVGGEERTLHTRATAVGGALAQAGVVTEPSDTISPPVTQPVTDGMTINVTLVRDAPVAVDEPIQFSTTYQYDADLPEGEQTVVQPGAEGNVHSEYIIHQVNGQETGRTLVAQSVTPSSDEVVAIGTYVAPPPPPARSTAPPIDGSGVCVRTITVWATWYTSASAGGSGTTATGTPVYKGIVAVDPRVIPLGTRMYVPGYGPALAADTGGGVIGYMIDLGYGDYDVYDWYSHSVDICILG